MSIRMTAGLATAAALLFAPATAAAQSTDVKCLLVSNLYSKVSKDTKARQLAEISKYYYLGRVYGRMSEAQLKTQLAALQKVVTSANAGETMAGCARGMQAAAATIQRVAAQAAPRR